MPSPNDPGEDTDDFLPTDRETLQALFASLDEAEKEIDDGLGVSADQLRQSVRTWIEK